MQLNMKAPLFLKNFKKKNGLGRVEIAVQIAPLATKFFTRLSFQTMKICPHLGAGTDHTSKGISRSSCPAVTDEDAGKIINGIIPDFVIKTETSLA
jgi:hypothetical protein